MFISNSYFAHQSNIKLPVSCETIRWCKILQMAFGHSVTTFVNYLQLRKAVPVSDIGFQSIDMHSGLIW